jgi:hypothetical protein
MFVHAQDPHRPSGQLPDWLEDVAVLVMLFAAASMLGAIGLLLIVV